MLNNLIRALRLPFIAASVLPFAFGSFIARYNFNIAGFLLGLIAAASTHLSANLINDYADSRSGADWKDKRFFGFFGGSKLIQENILTEKFYFKAAVLFALIAALSVGALAVILKNTAVIGFYLFIIFLGWSYSAKPLQFSYRRLGEAVIFILFGPALVMGGYYIQTGLFPDLKSFLLSLPFSFFTTAILFANEVPDYEDDKNAGKMTWVVLCGKEKAYLIYGVLMLCAFLSISLCIRRGYLNIISLSCLILVMPAYMAMQVLRKHYNDKIRLVESSRATIGIQAFVSLVLILGVLL